MTVVVYSCHAIRTEKVCCVTNQTMVAQETSEHADIFLFQCLKATSQKVLSILDCFSWLGRNWFPPFSFVPRHKWWSPRVSSWRAKWACERLSTNDFGESSPHVMPNLLASWIYLNSSFIVKVFLDIGHSVKNCMQAISRDPEYSK